MTTNAIKLDSGNISLLINSYYVYWRKNGNRHRLVSDYLNWLAPLLLMLPLPPSRRLELERHAIRRPQSVYNFHRLYPEISDKILMNRILAEAVLRRSSNEH